MAREENRKYIVTRLYDNENAWCTILLILATALSFFPILVLNEGGSWTFFSLLPLWLITYFFGFRTGLIGSFMFSICKLIATFVSEVLFAGAITDPSSADMVRDSFIKGPSVFLLEYLIACTGFCLGGLLKQNLDTQRYINRIKNARELKPGKEKPILQIIGDIDKENSTFGLIMGYLIGVFVMFVCYVLAAPYYDAYPAGCVTRLDRLWYDIRYDGSYLLAEAATTVLVLCIPPVRETIFTLKHIANNPLKDPSITSF